MVWGEGGLTAPAIISDILVTGMTQAAAWQTIVWARLTKTVPKSSFYILFQVII